MYRAPVNTHVYAAGLGDHWLKWLPELMMIIKEGTEFIEISVKIQISSCKNVKLFFEK